jgi:ParB family chromosome partitioning protein
MIRTIPLNKLVPSTRNVRRSADERADLELKADIAAHGLLQNLVVTSARKPRGSFAVEAGGRRLRALQALAREGSIAKDHEVCCLLVEGGAAEAQEASLAENFQRLAMNPADECLAFRQLLDQGLEVEGIARRFGLTSRFVEGRLRLANLAPMIFEALGAGEISLEVAKAYAASADVERQAQVFEQAARSYMADHPDSIRRMMTEATVGASDRRAIFVGEEAYVAAGGRIERDLFAEAGEARLLDVALLERLALEKMEGLARSAAAEHELAFVRPTLERWVGFDAARDLRRVPVEVPRLSDEESARIEALEREIGELLASLETEVTGDAARAETQAKIRALDREIVSISDKRPVIGDELRGTLGTFLLIDGDGRPRLDSAFFAPIANGEEGQAEQAGQPEPEARPGEGQRRPGLARRLVDELAMQRRDLLAVHVAGDPLFALDLAIFLMIDRGPAWACGRSGSTLSAARPSDPVAGFATPDARATLEAAQACDALDRSWAEGSTRAERFDAFRALPDAGRAAWLGHAVAGTLEASSALPGERACTFHDHLGTLLGIDVAAWWRPTGANYFDRVPKASALAALAEVAGPALAASYSRAKKAEIAEACERIFAGGLVTDEAARQAALAWVPEPMRFTAAGDVMPGEGAGGQQAAGTDEAGPSGGPGGEEVGEAA